jgi:hypothetical protein
VRKRQGFPVGSRIAEQNALDVRDAERRELANLPRGFVFGGKAAARELLVRRSTASRSRHSLHSALDEICGFGDARAIGVDGNDDDIEIHFERILTMSADPSARMWARARRERLRRCRRSAQPSEPASSEVVARCSNTAIGTRVPIDKRRAPDAAESADS